MLVNKGKAMKLLSDRTDTSDRPVVDGVHTVVHLFPIQHFQDFTALTGEVVNKPPKHTFTQCNNSVTLSLKKNRVKICLIFI